MTCSNPSSNLRTPMRLDFFLSTFAAFLCKHFQTASHIFLYGFPYKLVLSPNTFHLVLFHVSYPFANLDPMPWWFFHSMSWVAVERRWVTDGLLTSNHTLAALRVMILEKTNKPENNESSVLWGLSLFSGSPLGQWKYSQ